MLSLIRNTLIMGLHQLQQVKDETGTQSKMNCKIILPKILIFIQDWGYSISHSHIETF